MGLKLRKVHLYSDSTTPKSPKVRVLENLYLLTFLILTHVLNIGGSCWVASLPPADPEKLGVKLNLTRDRGEGVVSWV